MTHAKKIVGAALDRGGALLGHMLWWRLEDVRTPVATFKAAWTGAGLGEKYLPETPTPGRALRDAGTAAMRGQEHHLFRFAADTGAHLIYAIVREEADGKGDVTYVQEAQIAVDGAGQITSDHPEHPLVAAVKSGFDVIWGCYQHRDVVASILRVLKDCAAVTLRDSGGIYYVPAPFAATVSSLETAIRGVGRSEVTALPITADPEAKAAAALGAAAKGGIERDLAALREEMDAFSDAVLAGEKGPRASTVERRLEEFQALRERALLYRDVLAVEVGDLDTQIKALEEQAETVLTVLDMPPAPDTRQATIPGIEK